MRVLWLSDDPLASSGLGVLKVVDHLMVVSCFVSTLHKPEKVELQL